jgi:type 1 glutamine amidotransferase
MNRSNHLVSRIRKALRVPCMLACAWAATSGEARPAPDFKVLVFCGWAHDPASEGIRAANTLIRSLGTANGFTVDTTVVGGSFTSGNLDRYRVVIMNNSSGIGKLLDTNQRAALMDFLQTHGHIGIHYAAQTAGSWDEYEAYIGNGAGSHVAAFATLRLDSSQTPASMHPIVRGMPVSANFDDSWLGFHSGLPNPRQVKGMRILYTLDEASCPTCLKSPDGDNQAVWVRTLDEGGRMFYMTIGFNPKLFKSNAFCQSLLLRGIQWAAGVLEEPSAITTAEPRQTSAARSRIPIFPSRPRFRYWIPGVTVLEPVDLTGRLNPSP